jgi:hypothetical protein
MPICNVAGVPFAAALALCAGLVAQDLTWSRQFPIASPAARTNPLSAYDAARQRVLVYGGIGAAGGWTGDQWEWDGANWTQVSSLAAPGVRLWAGMAYDGARQRTVLYGGQQSGTGVYPTTTWLWDGTAWQSLATTPNPGQRLNHAMAYDSARQRVVLFGGSLVPSTPFSAQTWEWNGAAWTLMAPSASPPGRQGGCMAYDAVRQRMVLFGGLNAAFAKMNDTWEYDGSTWVQRTSATTPPARNGHTLAFDASRQTVVMYGGAGSPGLTTYGDTWEWNGVDWIASTPAANPGLRGGGALQYDAARQSCVFFGGAHPTLGAFNWTWMTYSPALATPYGAGCGTPTMVFTPDPNARPLLGATAAATVDNAPYPYVGVAVGFSRTVFGQASLPLPLDLSGMTGCTLLQSLDVFGLGTTAVGPSSHRYALAIPNLPALLCQRIYLQGYALAPGQNPLNVLATNGLEWRFGNIL